MYKMSLNQLLPVLFIGITFASCQPNTEPEIKNSIASEFLDPAYPLIIIDPYTSAWSMSDNLYDSPIKHWTGKTYSLIGAIRFDSKNYRFLMKEERPLPPVIPKAKHEHWQGKYVIKCPSEG